MAMRLSGLMSGMDTESIVAQLVEAKKVKVTKAVKAQKTLKYKQDAWKALNTKIVSLYDKALGNMRFESAFRKKITKVSNSSVVSVITGEKAMNSVQSLQVKNLATTGFLTGGKLPKTVKDVDKDGKEIDVALSGKTTLGQLGLKLGDGGTGSFTVSADGKSTNVTVSESTTIDSFISTLREIGLNANLDEGNGRIFISSKASGKDNDFSISANNASGFAALEAMGLGYGYDAAELKAKYEAEAQIDANAEISKRSADKLKELTDSRNALTTTRRQLLDLTINLNGKLVNSGITLDENFDYDKLTDEQKAQLNTAIKEVVEEKKDTDPDTAKALSTWVSDWKKNANALKKVEGQLDLSDTANIKLSEAAQKEVETQVKNEIAGAEEALRWLEKHDKMTDAEKAEFATRKAAGEDALITLNGVAYTSDKNSFEINGLSLTVSAKTAEGETVTITTEDDVSGVYDMIKGFLKDYNALINEMDKLYNADSAKGYEPLTDEEKDAMSDSQIEEWETKIKDAILRKDSSLSTISSAMKTIMLEGVEVNGKKMYLSNFGINTLNYFSAPENERNAYHIDGDSDDAATSGEPDKLKTMIANDPDTVISFFTKLASNLREKMFDVMKGTENSSVLTAYDDKKMQVDYDDYTVKIKELEKKLADYEDKWYAKFAAMETAMAKMQNNASAVTSLLGG